MKWRKITVGCLGLLAVLWFSGCNKTEPGTESTVSKQKVPDRPNVILISDDTLRADFLSAYRASALATPAIDSLAKDGVLFEQAFSSASWTLPSMVSIMTGLSSDVHQVVKRRSRIPDSSVTLAERLQSAGYQTAAFGRNHFINEEHNLNQGFDFFDFYPKHWDMPEDVKEAEGLSEAPHVGTVQLTNLAMDWIQNKDEKPFFLWLHYLDPHQPYVMKPRFLPPGVPDEDRRWKRPKRGKETSEYTNMSQEEKSWARTLYASEIQQIDADISRFLDFLKQINLYNDTLIVFTGDHGEELWDHQDAGHGHSLYNEVLRVPLIFKLPQSPDRFRGMRVGNSVSTSGIYGTILELCREEFEAEEYSFPSLVSLWEDPSTREDRPVVSQGVIFGEEKRSVILGTTKIIRNLETGETSYYDLASDPGEHFALGPEREGFIELMNQAQERSIRDARRLRALHGLSEPETIEFDQRSIANLKALGYL